MKTNPIIKLIDTVCEVFMMGQHDKPFFPRNGTTYCNEAVNQVLLKYEYKKFNKPSFDHPYNAVWANSMIWEMMNNKNDWMAIAGDVAQCHANCGSVVIAGLKNLNGDHGHVCVVMPGTMSMSGHLNKMVPKVMNIGKDVFIGKGSSYAFHTEPLYFVLLSTIIKEQQNA